MNIFTKLINGITHPDLLDENHPDYRKARIFGIGMMISAISILVYSGYFLAQYPLNPKNTSNLLGCLALLITLGLFRYQSNLKISYGFIMFACFPLVVFGVYITGGIYSSNLIWFIILSNSVYFNINKKTGVIYSILCFATYVIFYYLSFDQKFDLIFKDFIFKHHSLDNFFNICFSSLFSSLLVYSFASTVEDINLKIKRANTEKLEFLNEKLAEKTTEISNLRSNLAKDFHDEMGNKLAGISVLSQMLEKKLGETTDPETIQALETIRKRSNELFLGTKDFIWSIDFKSDYLIHIYQYIKEFGEDFFPKLEISFQAKFDSAFGQSKITITSGRQVVAIIKEAMTNVAKHAHATEVNLNVFVENNQVVFELKDNGIGFDYSKVTKNGIQNMQERTTLIKGQLEFLPTSQGTILSLRVPLEILVG